MIVLPAWIAGIQVRKDASGNIHVTWILALHAGMTILKRSAFKLAEATPPAFSKESREGHEGRKQFSDSLPLGYPLFVSFEFFVVATSGISTPGQSSQPTNMNVDV
jgi:hypothetical protein